MRKYGFLQWLNLLDHPWSEAGSPSAPRKISESMHDYAPVICIYASHPQKPTEMVGDGRAKVQANYSLFVPAVPWLLHWDRYLGDIVLSIVY